MTINDIDLQDIYEFMEKGNVQNAPPEIVQYLELLDKVRGMLLRIDKFSNDEAIVKDLMLVNQLSRYKAKQVIDQAREYFYKDNVVSKTAWRNIYSDKADKMLHFAMLSVKDAKEAIAIIKSIRDIIEIRGLNEPEQEDLPDELFQKPMKLYSLDARVSEFSTPADRNKLAKFIDSLPELTEREKIRIKEEALVLPLKIFPNEQENARKL
jgi:hypothetical protein